MLFNMVYNYWHPADPSTAGSRNQIPDGFYNPLPLVIEAANEYSRTGRFPEAVELAHRLNSRLKQDVDTWNALLEQGKPPPPSTNTPKT